MLKKYSKKEFLNLLEDKIEKAGGLNKGGLNNLANSLNVSNAEVSYALNDVRNPSAKLLSSLGLRREISYVSTSEEEKEKKDEE